jgi:hypothetical protein
VFGTSSGELERLACGLVVRDRRSAYSNVVDSLSGDTGRALEWRIIWRLLERLVELRTCPLSSSMDRDCTASARSTELVAAVPVH